MKVTKFNRLSELIANNTLVYVLGEHGTVVVGVGGSLGVVLCSEELERKIHVPGGSTFFYKMFPDLVVGDRVHFESRMVRLRDIWS